MKRFLVSVLASLALAAAALAGGGTTPVTSTTLKLLGTGKSTTDWVASTAYVQGQMVKSAGTSYFCLVAGTSGTTAISGFGDITDNAVTWRSILPRKRRGLVLSNLGSDNVQFSWGQDIGFGVGAGVILAASEKVLFSGLDDTPNGNIFATSTGSTTNSVVVSEWR